MPHSSRYHNALRDIPQIAELCSVGANRMESYLFIRARYSWSYLQYLEDCYLRLLQRILPIIDDLSFTQNETHEEQEEQERSFHNEMFAHWLINTGRAPICIKNQNIHLISHYYQQWLFLNKPVIWTILYDF